MAISKHFSRRSLIMMAGTTGLLTACGQVSLDQVAGADIDEGGFGDPTFNNHLAQTGQINARINLARKFTESVPTTVNFAFDSSVIDGEGQQVLRQQADFMRQFPELKFSVYGHTDAVGGEAANLRLGRQRATAVVRALGANGISNRRLEALVSFGERQLLVQTPDRERANRRTVTEVSGFLESDPMVLDGQYANLINRNYVASQLPAE